MSSLHEEPIPFRTAGIAIVLLSVVIVAILCVFNSVNWARKQSIVREYTQMHERFIQDGDNPAVLQQIFTTDADECIKIKTTKDSWPSSYSCLTLKRDIDRLEKRALENFSAIAFARVRGGDIEIFEASGDYHESRSIRDSYDLGYGTREDLAKYLIEGKLIDRWQDFISYLPRKEVITPIKINDSTIGYMFQSVIEK